MHVSHAFHMHEPGTDARIWTCDVWWAAQTTSATASPRCRLFIVHACRQPPRCRCRLFIVIAPVVVAIVVTVHVMHGGAMHVDWQVMYGMMPMHIAGRGWLCEQGMRCDAGVAQPVFVLGCCVEAT